MADRDADHDAELVTRLRQGDEAAFATLIDRHHGALRRVARMFVSSDASADELVQDTWMAVLDGLRAFEGRSSLKTWMFRILVNKAKTRGVREARSVPASALHADDADDVDPAVEASRFDERGMWRDPPQRWDAEPPERLLLRRELGDELELAMRALPERQRQVLVLRDALGWTAEEVCNVLEVQETNQRVLLHRARSKLHARLEHHKADR